jgi:hypothetical protein
MDGDDGIISEDFAGLPEQHQPTGITPGAQWISQALENHNAVIAEERERIQKDVLAVVGGIAVSHRWFPLQAVIDAIHDRKPKP